MLATSDTRPTCENVYLLFFWCSKTQGANGLQWFGDDFLLPARVVLGTDTVERWKEALRDYSRTRPVGERGMCSPAVVVRAVRRLGCPDDDSYSMYWCVFSAVNAPMRRQFNASRCLETAVSLS